MDFGRSRPGGARAHSPGCNPGNIARRIRARPVRGAGTAALILATLTCLLASPAFADPATDYVLNCRGCHRPDGEGLPGAAPSLHGLAQFLAVPGGREYLVRVPGVSESELSDARTAALLNWLLRHFGDQPAGPGPAPFTAAEVAAHRRPPLADAQAVRRRLLRRIKEK